jgi:hypothetical protein
MNPATNKANRDLLRKQYLNNLLLEAKNNDINYQANKILQITGEEPVRPPDTSSIEDKFKNVLNLQTLVRSQLMELTDGTNANQIVDGLSDDMLQFVAQRMPSLVEELKPKYALGIPAQVFLQYVKKLKLKAEATLDIEYGSSGQTPFSSAVTTPELDFGDIYEQATPSTPINPMKLEFKTANEKAPEPKAKQDTSPFQALENVKSLDDFKKLLFKDKKAWLTAKARGEKFTLNGNPINKSDLKAGNLENTNVYEIVSKIVGNTQGKGIRYKMKGKGLKIKTKSPRIKVDSNAGIMKQHRYIPFGRYVINRHQLNNKDIVMIKTMKGGAITNLPTTKISNSLSNVFQRMIGGQLPSFDDLNDLSADDKNQLHHITKKCEINVSVPTPNKDKLQKEMNRFEILKGEILAGNDNKEMVKEFKVMLLIFMNENRIPRRQGQEILTDLVAMGY